MFLNLKKFVRHEDCVLRISLPGRMDYQEEPEPEEDVDGELGLHDAQVRRSDQSQHQRRRQVTEAVGLLWQVVQLE